MPMKKDLLGLFELAKVAREFAYSPYSKYKVGAAIRLKDGRVYSGCNVENSTYGATTCAEQVAILKAVSENRKIQIAEVFVVTDSKLLAAPCGICRQVINEFGPNAKVHIANLKGKIVSRKIKDLLPMAFTSAHLDV